MKKIFFYVGIFVLLNVFSAVSTVSAAITFGSGYYTNLCDSGTNANYYSCDKGCDPAKGSCTSENNGVVKWVCTGKWNQCLESEGQWTNFEQVDKVSCGYTVALSKFDKKCRTEDGKWDNSCKLLGYMVWYSGDCYPSSGSKLQLPSVVPSTKPTPTSTPAPVNKICGLKCIKASDCQVGFTCVSGVCRNPSCVEDKTCFCKGTEASTASAVVKKTPSTGLEVWVGAVATLALGVVGIKLRRYAARLV